MFDPISRELLRQAPELPGLRPGEIEELLIEAHVELATVRLELAEKRDGLDRDGEKVIDRVRRLASTFEAYVALKLRPEQTRAAAFVAASAHQIISKLRTVSADKPTMVTSDAIGAAISATLLYLIADRAADAAEAASQLRARGEAHPLRRALILNLRELAKGDLTPVLERDLGEYSPTSEDSRETATDLLYRECALVLQVLAREARGELPFDIDIVETLDRIIRLSETTGVHLASEGTSKVYHQYAGPHHFATLLSHLIKGMREAMIVRLPVPSEANARVWNDWLTSQSVARPFLWVNHLKAVNTGYLNRGRSMVMTSPTGSGKTTLSVLKIAATLCSGGSVVYLAPTHALVDQVEADMTSQIGSLEDVSVVEDLTLEDLGERLPRFSVMTPERCLALMGAAPSLFDKVDLLVFDEFHLISADAPLPAIQVNARAIDAMLALLTFLKHRKSADVLLLSAMVADGEDVARWLKSVTGREVEAFNDPWKPTRQLRTCVIYDAQETAASYVAAAAGSTKTARKQVPVSPLGLFSLISGWHPKRPEKLIIRPLTSRRPPLLKSEAGYLTANRNEVAAQIAVDLAAAGKRVIVFCSDTKGCGSVADAVNSLLPAATAVLNPEQEILRSAVLADIGSSKAAFDPSNSRAAVHHGDLLPVERRLTESVFRTRRNAETEPNGLDVIAATSTIAQGLNLPCDVVILAGTDRSVADDPNGNPRQNLRPHEILNALGRAGRASYAATGVAIVVPATPIQIDPKNLDVQNEAVLSTVFSDKDACEPVYDPIEQLLDRIEADADPSPRIQAIIRRLSSVTTAGDSGFDDIVRRSLGYFRKKERSLESANQWLEARRVALKRAESQLKDPEVLDWQREIAVRNGVPPSFIDRLVAAMPTAPVTETRTSKWLEWILGIVAQNPKDLTIFVREKAIEEVFGRAYTNATDPIAANVRILAAIRHLTSMWCDGCTIIAMEDWILNFVWEHEGAVLKKAPRSTTAQRARRFAIRIAPDLGFLCSVLGQVVAHKVEAEGRETIPLLDMLPQMVRSGDGSRHQAALRQMTASASRVVTFSECAEMQGSFKATALSDMDDVRSDITRALTLKAFLDEDFDD